MQLKAVSILCVLLAAQVFAVRDVSGISQRTLKQPSSFSSSSGSGGTSGPSSRTSVDISSSASSDSPDGSAFSSAGVGVRLVGPGVVTAFARATAMSVTSVRNALVDAVVKSVAAVRGGGDAIAIADVEAKAYAEAVARTLAETVVSLESDAEGGSGCAFAVADARATARAFAQILVDVLATASNDYDFANAVIAVNAIVSATVSAYANAQSQACGKGVFSADTYISVLSEALAIPFVEVFALAFALVAPGVAVADIVVIAVADVLQVSTVTGFTASRVLGDADANSGGSGGTDTKTGP